MNQFDDVGQEMSTMLVAGPLRRPMGLPTDAFAALSSAVYPRVGDADGDHAPELVIRAEDDVSPGRYVLELPLAGPVEVVSRGTFVRGDVADLDGDGVLDQVNGAEHEIRVTWGPVARWSGPPDLVIATSCAAPYGFLYVEQVDALPDIDEDGRREIWFGDREGTWGWDYYCTSWLFPLPERSIYDPASDSSARYGIPRLVPIGDQTGDGSADVWSAEARVVYGSPVDLSSAVVRSDIVIRADDDLLDLVPLSYDLDGDGLVDFVGLDAHIDTSEVQTSAGGPVDPVRGEVLVLVSGGTSLASPVYAAAWDIDGRAFQADDAFLEDGVVSMLVGEADSVLVVDLGPGVVP